MSPLHVRNVVVDTLDAHRAAEFWQPATGFERSDFGDWVMLRDPAGKAPSILLQPVPEARAGKNRVHIDFGSPDRDAEVHRLELLGARAVGQHEQMGLSWTVMADPDGNEFCVAQHAGD